MLARRIPEILSIEAPASGEQIEGLASTLGLRLPDEYRALLAEANGISANLVQIYPAEAVPERNTTFDVAGNLSGYFVIGTVNDFPVLLRAGASSPVFENDWDRCASSHCARGTRSLPGCGALARVRA